MTWVVWRLNRSAGVVAMAVLSVLVIFFTVTGLAMAHTFQQSGLGACLAHTTDPGACGLLGTSFLNQFRPLLGVTVFVLILPILLGVLVGAPLVARELEQGTHRLLWLQSITRVRWLAVTLA